MTLLIRLVQNRLVIDLDQRICLIECAISLSVRYALYLVTLSFLGSISMSKEDVSMDSYYEYCVLRPSNDLKLRLTVSYYEN